jgi:LEA14-like dessication related protein
MKNNRIRNIAGLLVLFIALYSCNAYKSVDIGDVSNVNFKGMVDNKISIELSIPVTNPNGYKIKIKEMDLDVTINGKYLGKMKNSSEIVIPSKSDEVQVFPVDIHVSNLLTSMSSLYKMRKAKSFEMQIEGKIKVKAFLNSKTIEVSEIQSVSL